MSFYFTSDPTKAYCGDVVLSAAPLLLQYSYSKDKQTFRTLDLGNIVTLFDTF